MGIQRTLRSVALPKGPMTPRAAVRFPDRLRLGTTPTWTAKGAALLNWTGSPTAAAMRAAVRGADAVPGGDEIADVIGRPVMVADGALGLVDELAGQFGSDTVTAIVAQLGDPMGRSLFEIARGRTLGQQAGGRHGVEAVDVAGDLGKAEIDQAVKLAHAVVEVLLNAGAMMDEFAQGLGSAVVRPGWGGSLFVGEMRQALGIDGVGLGALEAAVLKTARHGGVEHHHVVPGGGQGGEQLLPGVPGCLQGGRGAERLQQLVVALPVVGDGQGLADGLPMSSRRASQWRSDAMSMPENMGSPPRVSGQ